MCSQHQRSGTAQFDHRPHSGRLLHHHSPKTNGKQHKQCFRRKHTTCAHAIGQRNEKAIPSNFLRAGHTSIMGRTAAGSTTVTACALLAMCCRSSRVSLMISSLGSVCASCKHGRQCVHANLSMRTTPKTACSTRPARRPCCACVCKHVHLYCYLYSYLYNLRPLICLFASENSALTWGCEHTPTATQAGSHVAYKQARCSQKCRNAWQQVGQASPCAPVTAITGHHYRVFEL